MAYQTRTLQEWCDGFYKIYKSNDSQRSLSNFWVQVSNDASKVSESVRRREYEEAIYHLGNAFCWTCCFAERMRSDMMKIQAGKDVLKIKGDLFQDWILNRYPFACHHCGENPCHCLLDIETIERRKDGEKEKEKYDELMSHRSEKLVQARQAIKGDPGIKNLSLIEFFNKFSEIHGNRLFVSSLEEITFHYLEEIGEVGQAIAMLETLVGETSADSWGKLAKADPDLKLISRFRPEELKSAFELAKQSFEGKPALLDQLAALKSSDGYGRAAYRLGCDDIIDELCDVFSWTSSIAAKIRKLEKKTFTLVDVFRGEKNVIGKREKKYVHGENFEFRCPYCMEKSCTVSCPLSNALKKAAESTIS